MSNLQTIIVIGFDNTSQIDIYFHNKNMLFFPNRNSAFGSDMVTFLTKEHITNRSTGLQNYYAWLHLDKVEEQSLDKPADRCDSRGKVGETNLARCIARHIERTINCS